MSHQRYRRPLVLLTLGWSEWYAAGGPMPGGGYVGGAGSGDIGGGRSGLYVGGLGEPGPYHHAGVASITAEDLNRAIETLQRPRLCPLDEHYILTPPNLAAVMRRLIGAGPPGSPYPAPTLLPSGRWRLPALKVSTDGGGTKP